MLDAAKTKCHAPLRRFTSVLEGNDPIAVRSKLIEAFPHPASPHPDGKQLRNLWHSGTAQLHFVGTWPLMQLSLSLASSTIKGRGKRFNFGELGLSDPAQASARAKRRLRRFSRYRFDSRIQLSVFRDGLTSTCWGRTSELGQDGIGATLSAELQAGEVVSLEFPIPLPPHLMKVRAVVRYSEGLRCGFEFLVVTDEQKMLLRQLCVVLANAPC
jgi:hypothetical protein